MKFKKGIIWVLAFLFVFMLSQDYLFVQWEGTPSFLGFPIWIGWFAFVHLLFIAIFYFFTKKYWKQ